MERREFLRAGGTALIGLAAAACGGGRKTPPDSNGAANTIEALTKGKQNTMTLVGVQPSLTRPNDRLAIALLSPDGATAYKGGTVKAWLARTRTEPVIGPIDLVYHGEGFERGVYVGRVTFPAKGQWLIYAEATPEGVATTLTGGTTLQVGHVPTAPGREPQPVPGDAAVSTPTPTVENARGVDPICTRKPPCSMHQISLDEALRNAKPTVLTIGTPAFCQTRFCGPVVDSLMKVQAGPLGSKIDFVHIELYADDKDAPAKAILSPAAAAWRVEAEPVVYYIKPDGSIVDWAIGATDAPEINAIAQSLL